MIHPLVAGFGQTFRPAPVLQVWEWADRYRILPRSGSSEHGPYRTSRTPYLREIMEALSESSPARFVTIVKGSQTGGTEAATNWLMQVIDSTPAPILAVQPTIEAAKRWSKQRLGPSFLECKRLRGKVADVKSRDGGNTILQKDFPGGTLIIGGANSPASLASMPIKKLMLDEVDRYPEDAGEEGDPCALAERRTATFPDAKVLYISTPTNRQTSRIWRHWENSDKRVFEVPCPHCGAHQQILFENLRWARGRPQEAELACVACGVLISESHKTRMLELGKWRATNPGHPRVGFHLSAIYTPIGLGYSWAEVAAEFEAAEGDPLRMKVFENTIKGLPWEEKGEELSGEYLDRRREEYAAEVPEGALLLVLSVDVQHNRLEYEVSGWGNREESWGIAHGVIMGDPSVLDSGDPSNPSVWSLLEQLRRREFFRANGDPMRIACTVIDSGGHHTDEVYKYCKPRERVRVYAIKGSSKTDGPLVSKPTRSNRIGCPLYSLNVHKLKDIVYGRLKIDPEKCAVGPGVCHFPADEEAGYDAAYYSGLMSEMLVERRVNGQKVLRYVKKTGARNEPLDLRVYGTAAIRLLAPNWKALSEIRAGNAVKKPVTALPPRRPRQSSPVDLDALLAKFGIR